MFHVALAITLALLAPAIRGQGDLSAANNVTDLEGTWSSNAAVSTGGDFCTPGEMKFAYPNNTGIAYSFTNTGFFEEAQYRYAANASNPNCIQATIFWQHGTYGLNNNGSLTLYPFGEDGRIQVQDPCAAVTNIITYYDQQTLYADWGITIDQDSANYVLRVNRFDGAKMPPMYLTAKPPNMLPTQILTGTNASGQTQSRKRSTKSINPFRRSSSAPVRTILARDMVLAGSIGSAMLGFAVLGLQVL
ncbi:MAG: Reversal of tor2 lethality [Tremellales sp. Tagirdzhanova-0007]|nr:MAG: Reversal of tor2 lethality [Tremellales sp. Tagirdzhanova-0007]